MLLSEAQVIKLLPSDFGLLRLYVRASLTRVSPFVVVDQCFTTLREIKHLDRAQVSYSGQP